jgi:hypothetical protein
LLNRLVKKKAVGFQRDGRTHLYRPLVKEADCVSAASESFLERVFGGSLTPMLAHFVQQRKLSAAEKRELKAPAGRRELSAWTPSSPPWRVHRVAVQKFVAGFGIDRARVGGAMVVPQTTGAALALRSVADSC